MTNVDLEPKFLAPIAVEILFLRWLEKSDGKKDCNGKREIAPKKRFRGNCFEFEILRNKKPEI